MSSRMRHRGLDPAALASSCRAMLPSLRSKVTLRHKAAGCQRAGQSLTTGRLSAALAMGAVGLGAESRESDRDQDVTLCPL